MRARLNLLESILGNARDAILVTEAEPIDAPGPKIVYANESFTRITGYSFNEIFGKTPRVLQGVGTDRSELDSIRAALTEWEPVRAELLNYGKDGAEFWVEVDIVPAIDKHSDHTHWISVQRDVMERRKQEKALRESEERLALDTDLCRAIEREEFTLQYQPIFSLEENTIVGAEALVRWEHPERGLLPPAEFIPLAEQGGIIVPLGDWVLKEACCWAKGRQEQNPLQQPISVSVNLSAKQLERPNFAEDLQTALKGSGLDPRTLVLEITESTLVDSANYIHKTLNSIKEYGVRLAVDDFGTGYSSLYYLNRFPVDIIKIDRSFISKLSKENHASRYAANEKLVSGIIDLAHDQDLTVVAEGLENTHQAECLGRMNCNMVQGYLFSKPVTGEEFSALVETNLR